MVRSDTDVVQPRLLFISMDRAHLLSGGENVRGAPGLVVEVLSPATADRGRGYKRTLYAKHGVAEYWVVDPSAETFSIHRLHGPALRVALTLRRERTCAPPFCPGSL